MVFPYHDFMAGGRYPAGAEILLNASRYVLSEITSEKYPFYGKVKKCYSASPDFVELPDCSRDNLSGSGKRHWFSCHGT